jgi:predicted nucleic acid-binding protein
MRLIVTDANILIDLEVGQLLDVIFDLEGVEFLVPDVLFVEELEASMGHLPARGLNVVTLSEAIIADVEILRARYPAPGSNDLLALGLAKAEQCLLLSGDGALRTAAIAEQVDVHGTLWLIEKLRDAGLVDAAQAKVAYDLMRAGGSRLPWGEVAAQLRRWGLGVQM